MRKGFVFLALLLGVAPLAYLFFPASKQQRAVDIVYPVTEEKTFVIVIPSYNNLKWCEKNIASVLEQDYTNFRILYIDDASNDGMSEKVKELAAKNPRITLICNATNRGALANLYHAIHSCKKEEIVLTLDGDDWLAHPGVLRRLNEIYANPHVWIAHSQYVSYPDYALGPYSTKTPTKVISERSFRKHKWRSSQLRTFYASLFQKIDPQDLQYEGEFFKATYDMALMFPMLEMGSSHLKFIEEVLYIYNRDTPLNDDKVRPQIQIQMERYIREKPSYPEVISL